jgi:hypothetical protein
MLQKYPINKPFRLASFFYLISILLFIVTQVFFANVFSTGKIASVAFFFSSGICFSIIGVVYTYYSWTLSAQDFVEWYINQQMFGKDWARKSFISPEIGLWSFRLIGGPVTSIVGILLTGFMLFEIATLLLGQ